MITELKELGSLKRSLTLEIPLEDVRSKYDEIVRELKNTHLRGFRPGKFPKGWIDKRFKDRMSVEATNNLIPHHFRLALDELDLMNAGRPSLEDLSFDRRKPLVAVLSFEIVPPLSSLDYSRLTLEAGEPLEISEEQLEEEFQELRMKESSFESKPEDSVAENDDLIVIDYTLFQEDGSTIKEESGVAFTLGHDSEYTELQAHILGMKVGEQKEVVLDSHKDEDVAEGEVIPHKASLTLNELKSRTPAELNDAFFERLGCKTKEEVIGQIKYFRLEGLRKIQFQERSKKLEDQMLEFYGEFELPEEMLAEELGNFEEDRKKRQQKSQASQQDAIETAPNEAALNNEAPPSEEDTNEEAIDEEKTTFMEGIRLRFILQSISKEASIKVDSDRVQERLASFANNLQLPQEFFTEERISMFYDTFSKEVLRDQIMEYVEEKVLGPPSA